MRTPLALVYIFIFAHGILAEEDVIVKDLKLFVNCEEFFIKAMCYAPAPLGYTNNGGLCSYKQTAYGDYKPNCYDRCLEKFYDVIINFLATFMTAL